MTIIPRQIRVRRAQLRKWANTPQRIMLGADQRHFCHPFCKSDCPNGPDASKADE